MKSRASAPSSDVISERTITVDIDATEERGARGSMRPGRPWLRARNVAFMLSDMGRKPKNETPVHNRLEEVREGRGLTRAELAYAADVHYQTIGYIERGEYSPSLSLALTLARILRADIHEIFSLEPFSKQRATTR